MLRIMFLPDYMISLYVTVFISGETIFWEEEYKKISFDLIALFIFVTGLNFE